MIDHIKGTLTHRDPSGAVIETSGVGFRMAMSTSSLAAMGETGSEALAFTLLQIRDDAASLYGFATVEERALFAKLITVSGIGPKVALSALSAFRAADLAALIATGDVGRITGIPGIGKKTAQRIVLDLKGSLDDCLVGNAGDDASATATAAGAAKDAAEALASMGFSAAEVNRALEGYGGDDGDLNAILKHALKRLGGA
jgi:Holliday junction DNA helicase RuvA